MPPSATVKGQQADEIWRHKATLLVLAEHHDKKKTRRLCVASTTWSARKMAPAIFLALGRQKSRRTYMQSNQWLVLGGRGSEHGKWRSLALEKAPVFRHFLAEHHQKNVEQKFEKATKNESRARLTWLLD